MGYRVDGAGTGDHRIQGHSTGDRASAVMLFINAVRVLSTNKKDRPALVYGFNNHSYGRGVDGRVIGKSQKVHRWPHSCTHFTRTDGQMYLFKCVHAISRERQNHVPWIYCRPDQRYCYC